MTIIVVAGGPAAAGEAPRPPGQAERPFTAKVGGFFGDVWDGLVDVVTLRAVFGDADGADQTRASYAPPPNRGPGPMSRMLSRMGGGEDVEEDEYGLPRRR